MLARRHVAATLALLSLVAGVALTQRNDARATALSFAPSVRPACVNVTAFNCDRNNEPSIVVDADGNLYLSSILGVPAGVNLWKRPAGSSSLRHLGIPDGLPVVTSETDLALGGGDVDLAIATERNALGNYNLYVSSLSLASITISRSEDGGKTFFTNPVSTAPILGVDRQWLMGDGANTLYLVFRDMAPMWWVRVSHDGGTTFSAPSPLIAPELVPVAANPQGSASRAGNLAFNRVTKDLYMPFTNVATMQEAIEDVVPRHTVYMARWHEGMPHAVNSVVYNGPVTERVDAVFPTAGVDDAGAVYAAWSTTAAIFMASSTDHGATWSPKVRVSKDPVKATVQPWIAAGSPGRVAVGYLGASLADMDAATNTWRAYMSMSLEGACQRTASCAANGEPAFEQVEASDHIVHRGSVCLRGLSCDTTAPGDRSLAEVTVLAIDADGMAVMSWPDTSAGPAYPYIAKQNGGTALRGTPAAILPIDNGLPPGTFTPAGTQTLYFHGHSPSPVTLPDGSDVQAGAEGTMTAALPDDPHVALVGAPFTRTPVAGRPAVFESDPLGPVAVGGSVAVSLYMQGEGGQIGSGIVEYRLLEVTPDGSTREIASRPRAGNSSDNCCRFRAGVTAPALVSIAFPAFAPAQLSAGSRLRLELRFDVEQQSGVRLFYDNPSYPTAATFTLGTFV